LLELLFILVVSLRLFRTFSDMWWRLKCFAGTALSDELEGKVVVFGQNVKVVRLRG